MYRHPFANPEHLCGRASSPDYFNADRCALTSGPGSGSGPYAYRNIMPMASQSSLFGDTPPVLVANPQFLDVPTPARGRAASLPDPRPHPLRYGGALRASWTEGLHEVHPERGTGTGPVWRRVFRRITRRARRGVYKLRAFLQRDDRRSVSGFS